MSDEEFLKKIKEIGKIQEIEDAFKNNPAEEEEHQGKDNAYLSVAEDSEEYVCGFNYDVGDIVYVKEYKYKNGKIGKNHLFVIITKDNLAVPIEYFCMIISSKIYKRKYKTNDFLPKDNSNNLRVDSIVKMDVIYRIKENSIISKIGKVDNNRVKEYKEKYLEINEKT